MSGMNNDIEYPQNLLQEIFHFPRSLNNEYKEFMSNPLPEDFEGSLEYALYKMNPQEREVIRRRYKDKKTYRAIGEEMGLSAERIRQVKCRAIGKLRHPLIRKYIQYGVKGAEERALKELKESFSAHSTGEPNDGKTILLEDLELSIRAYNCLARAGVKTAGDITALGERFYTVRNLGRRCAEEVLDKLKQHGIDCTALES